MESSPIPLDRLVVCETSSDDSSIVSIGTERAGRLHLVNETAVLMKGRFGAETIAIMKIDETLKDDEIKLNLVTRLNLRVKPGQVVRLKAAPEKFPIAQWVWTRPFDDTPLDDVKLQSMVKDYFADKNRPVHRNDLLRLQSSQGVMDFIIARLSHEPFALVTKDTNVYTTGTRIKRAEFEKSLNMLGYGDIGGVQKEMDMIKEAVEMPLMHPEIFNKLGIKAPRGVLLYGPPGTGKTLIARCLSNEMACNLQIINGPEIMSKWVGESEKNLRDVFVAAETTPPAIIFIDEIDAIAPKREQSNSDLDKRIVSQLLCLMDGIKGLGRVVVIATTNRQDALDPALRRPGRFDREIRIGQPDQSGRYQILKIHTRQMRLAPDVDLAEIASMTHGCVGADLAGICVEAALQQIRQKLTKYDIEDGISDALVQTLAVNQQNFLYAISRARPSSLRETFIEIPNVSWDDIGGLLHVKQELRELIQFPISHPDKYEHFGTSPSRGILFYGPPGCGKTQLAKAVATMAAANFISVKGPELLSMWIGNSEANVRKVFQNGRDAAPCVIFFDEVDSMAATRGGGPGEGSATADRITNTLLTEMDGIGTKTNVFCMAATNRPDVLDPALIRPGRFDQLIYIPLPDSGCRRSILEANLNKTPLDTDVDLDDIVAVTIGFSGADLTGVCQLAVKLAIRELIGAEEAGKEGPSSVGRRHFEAALQSSRRSVSAATSQWFNDYAQKLQTSGAAADDDDDEWRQIYI